MQKTIDILKKHLDDDLFANELSVAEYNEAKKYYHGDHLPNDVKEILRERGQPILYENIYKTIVDKILGYKAQNIQEIKITGRQEEDKALANLLQDLVRVFSQKDNFDKEILKRDFELMLGLSVCEVWIEDIDGDLEVTLKTLPTHSIVIDRYSTDINALDARRFHKLINIDADLAKELFDSKVIIPNPNNHDSRVEIIESWYKEAEGWNRYIWQKKSNDVIAYEVTPFKDKAHPFIVSKFHIDHNNKWYGIFRDIKPLQDFINFTENKIANMMGSFKAFYESGSVIDKDKFIEEAGLDNAIVEVRDGAIKDGRLHFVQHHADIASLSQKVEQKRYMLKTISGLNEEALGMAGGRQSGVAIAQRRDAGLMGLTLYIKRGDDMDRLIYQKVLSLMQHYYTKQQTFRIVDKKVGDRYFSINTNKDNMIHIGKFDLILQSTPKMQGREERFAHWSELLKTISSIRPDLLTDLLPLMLKDTDSPIVADIEEILAQKDQALAKAQQAEAQQAQALSELEMQQMQSGIQKNISQANKQQAQAKMLEATTQEMNQNRVMNKITQHHKNDNTEIVKGKMQISPSDIR